MLPIVLWVAYAVHAYALWTLVFSVRYGFSAGMPPLLAVGVVHYAVQGRAESKPWRGRGRV